MNASGKAPLDRTFLLFLGRLVVLVSLFLAGMIPLDFSGRSQPLWPLLLAATALLVAVFLFLRQTQRGPSFQLAVILGDLLLVTLANYVSIRWYGSPLFFPLYTAVAFEAAWWWRWRGAVLSGLGSASLLGLLCYFVAPCVPGALVGGAMALTVGWSIVCGYATVALRHWLAHRERHLRPAGPLAQPEVQ